MTIKNAFTILLVGLLASGMGAGVAWWQHGRAVTALSEANAADVPKVAAPTLWQASFKDLQGKPQAFSQWRGKPLVVNFWAAWCGPCRDEIPDFVAAQKSLGSKVRFVGLAIDNPVDVQKFVKEFGIDYPILVGDQDAMELMRAEGNRLGALPFTVIYDPAGHKVAVRAGRLDKAQLDSYLQPML